MQELYWVLGIKQRNVQSVLVRQFRSFTSVLKIYTHTYVHTCMWSEESLQFLLLGEAFSFYKYIEREGCAGAGQALAARPLLQRVDTVLTFFSWESSLGWQERVRNTELQSH